ncbi:MAG: DoxX family membrane protein [Chlorobi bacterium]|nr:DoxX family membrane protein [Chlorobiota bacterium]
MQESSSTHTKTALNDEHPAMSWLSFGVRLLLGIIFLVSGAEKLGALDTFAHAIVNYEIIPYSLSNIFALLFVWTEIAIAVLLISGAAIRGAALVTSTLLVIFIVAILTAMARGLEIDCGCFAPDAGIEPEKVGWPKVFEDLALLAGAIFLIYFPKSPFTIDRLLRREGNEGEQG